MRNTAAVAEIPLRFYSCIFGSYHDPRIVSSVPIMIGERGMRPPFDHDQNRR
eukprot:COSAG01_NODE_1900_length_8964_cov_121.219177_10_plen_52_part_00